MPAKISPQRQQFIRERANFLCEYCHTSEKWQNVAFTIDHIVPLADEEDHRDENLALACFHCNRHKSYHRLAVDPQTETTVPLFNPRIEQWQAHFIWSVDGTEIVGKTAVGRATITLLKMNRERIKRIRAADVAVNRHPPDEDERLAVD